jgi:hypothetical protein
MDADRFNSLSKTLDVRRSRRTLLTRGGSEYLVALAGAAGIHRFDLTSQVPPDSNQNCIFDRVAHVLLGPVAVAVSNSSEPDSLGGALRFTHSEEGDLADAALQLSDDTKREIVGRAAGHNFFARIDFPPGQSRILVGVGPNPTDHC